MRLLRFFIISCLSLFAIAALIGILLPSTVLVSRAVDIAAPKEVIRPYVDSIQNWKTWMEGMDQAAVSISSYAKADLAGTEVTLTSISDSTLVSEWKARNGTVQVSTVRFISDTAHQVTVVQWQFVQKLKWYPWERLGSMMNDKILGTMMEKNLNKLKSLCEHKE
ncbi:MAG: SRPBCC family protein [Bacteroidota bacterium]|nr:SRPBCC family protein [Bacteroidota bacterium]